MEGMNPHPKLCIIKQAVECQLAKDKRDLEKLKFPRAGLLGSTKMKKECLSQLEAEVM